MTRHRLLLIGLLTGATAALLALWLLWPRTAITPENAAKIQVGMKLAEVEAILDGPARDDSTDLDIVVLPDENGVDDPDAPTTRVRTWLGFALAAGQVDVYYWGSECAIVEVILDETGRVKHSHSLPVRHVPENPLVMLRRLFGF